MVILSKVTSDVYYFAISLRLFLYNPLIISLFPLNYRFFWLLYKFFLDFLYLICYINLRGLVISSQYIRKEHIYGSSIQD